MSDTSYNLDNDKEYFEFTLDNHIYKVRYLNAEEIERFGEIKEENEKILDTLFTFITSDDPEAPDFMEASKKFTTYQWKKFFQMLKVEFAVQ